MGWTIAKGDQIFSATSPSRCGSGSLHCAARINRSFSEAAERVWRGWRVLEIVAAHDRNTWRAVYTVRFKDCLYVLHAFQKKSKKGIATPKQEIELIRQRLADAERNYRERQN